MNNFSSFSFVSNTTAQKSLMKDFLGLIAPYLRTGGMYEQILDLLKKQVEEMDNTFDLKVWTECLATLLDFQGESREILPSLRLENQSPLNSGTIIFSVRIACDVEPVITVEMDFRGDEIYLSIEKMENPWFSKPWVYEQAAAFFEGLKKSPWRLWEKKADLYGDLPDSTPDLETEFGFESRQARKELRRCKQRAPREREVAA